jgi:membrane protein YdbS with pleckstrin-like domain
MSRDLRTGKRRAVWLSMAVALVIAAGCGWAFTHGHAAVGIAVLVAFYVLPEFVLIPLRIRRSRRAADAARARRQGTSTT